MPLSSCSGSIYDPYVPDLLMPIRLGSFAANQSALAGKLTVIGKVVLIVRQRTGGYADLASLQRWSGASFWTAGPYGPSDDATVVAPGYVIQPLAIYK